jgi:hypothetical protein
MRNFLRSWWPRALSRRGCFIAPRLERLENRIVFALSATPLPFTAFGTAHVAADLTAPNAFDLYQVHLNAGDVVNIAVSSQIGGGTLQSNLRVFDATGRPMALDAQQGGDARLTFQAPRMGDYLVGVSSAGDDAYDPSLTTSGQGGVTTGLYALDLQRKPAVPLTPELAGSSFRLQADTAAYGDTVTGTFTVDNRGGAAASAFAVQVVLSPDNLFGPYFLVLTTFALPGLRAGQEFASGVFTMSLPDLAQATAAGLPVSGPVYLGLRIDPSGAVRELNPHDQSGVHAGEDWQALTVVTPFTFSGINHSPADAEVLGDPNSRVNGMLVASQTDWYQITVPASGRLTATVTSPAGSSLVPRLTLAGPSGQVLIQSDNAIVQHLSAGTYLLSVSAASGAATYRLTTDFVQGNAPFNPINLGADPTKVVVADLNGDGVPDIVTADLGYNGVTVLLGNGDGTFGPPHTYSVDSARLDVTVADVNGDGKPDLITANFEGDTVSVLLNNGDGTFRPAQSFVVGPEPDSVAVADLNGDGNPDLVVGIWGGGSGKTVSVLLGNGDGTFGPPRTFAVGQGPSAVVAADVNGDGIPDLVVTNQIDYDVSVLLGNGDGTFQAQRTFATGAGPVLSNDGLAVVDINGDGKPDIITAAQPTEPVAKGGGISVLLGNGDGTFQTPKTFATGAALYWLATADINGDGKLDLVCGGNGGLSFFVVLGNGDGTFSPPQTTALPHLSFRAGRNDDSHGLGFAVS